MKFICAITFSVCCATAFAQGTFQDLDFEQANPSAGYSTADLFPGWQVFIGTSQQSTAGFEESPSSVPFVSLSEQGYAPIQGNYTAILASGTIGDPVFSSTSVSLTQTGIVPSGTELIELDAYEVNGGSFVLSFNGLDIPMVPLQTFPNYTIYGGDVSHWAGQSALLDITQLAPPTGNQQFSPSGLQLDNITFSPYAITTPEPDAFTLMSVGGLLFGLYRRSQANRKRQ